MPLKPRHRRLYRRCRLSLPRPFFLFFHFSPFPPFPSFFFFLFSPRRQRRVPQADLACFPRLQETIVFSAPKKPRLPLSPLWPGRRRPFPFFSPFFQHSCALAVDGHLFFFLHASVRVGGGARQRPTTLLFCVLPTCGGSAQRVTGSSIRSTPSRSFFLSRKTTWARGFGPSHGSLAVCSLLSLFAKT